MQKVQKPRPTSSYKLQEFLLHPNQMIGIERKGPTLEMKDSSTAHSFLMVLTFDLTNNII